jgi:toxin-antitoxin system PIN domain toxin
MIIPDVNLLLHAYRIQSPHHKEARDWWEDTLNRERPIGLAWVTIFGFVRISTHRGISVNPLFPAEAMLRVRSCLAHPRVRIVTPGENHAETVFGMLEYLGTAGNLTTDAHLAALSIEYRAEIASTDTDFARFKGVRWFNPLRV